MRIGELAQHAGVSTQTLRYYERRGLLDQKQRTQSGYREYNLNAVRQVRFIRRAQDLGFTLEEIGDLLALWPDSVKSCAAVERRASATLARIEQKISDLRRMRDALSQYVVACQHRESLQECPLLGDLGVGDVSAND